MHKLHFLYHEIRVEDTRYAYVVKASAFERQMDLFCGLMNGAEPELAPQVTFDDGHVSNLAIALPILQARGMKARFFITVGWTGQKEGYMSWPQLRELHAAGQAIGAHGWTHALLTHCGPAQLRMELRDARLKLEDELGASVPTMSLPGGRYNRRVLEACSEAGYTQIFTSIPKAENSADEVLVGRLNVTGGMKLEWIAALLAPGSTMLTGLERKYKIKGFAKNLLGDRLYEAVWRLINSSEAEPEGEGA